AGGCHRQFDLVRAMKTAHKSEPKAFRSRALQWLPLPVAIVGVAVFFLQFRPQNRTASIAAVPQPVNSLPGLLALRTDHLRHVPIVRLNLLCAQGLDVTSEPDIENGMATLEARAKRVQS